MRLVFPWLFSLLCTSCFSIFVEKWAIERKKEQEEMKRNVDQRPADQVNPLHFTYLSPLRLAETIKSNARLKKLWDAIVDQDANENNVTFIRLLAAMFVLERHALKCNLNEKIQHPALDHSLGLKEFLKSQVALPIRIDVDQTVDANMEMKVQEISRYIKAFIEGKQSQPTQR